MERFAKYCLHQTRTPTLFKQGCISFVLFRATGEAGQAAKPINPPDLREKPRRRMNSNVRRLHGRSLRSAVRTTQEEA
jgi:hypothetical protein